jgi:hypothetical protein
VDAVSRSRRRVRRRPAPLPPAQEGSFERIANLHAACATLLRLAECLPQWGARRSTREMAGTLREYFDGEWVRQQLECERLRTAASGTLIERELRHPLAQFLKDQVILQASWLELRRWLSDIADGLESPPCSVSVTAFTSAYLDQAMRQFQLEAAMQAEAGPVGCTH